MDTMPIRAIVMLDDGWGANLTIEDEAPGILSRLESFGWELTLVSSKPTLKPCGMALRTARAAAVGRLRLSSGIADVSAYDVLVVAPGKGYAGLVADAASLDLVRRADEAGLAVVAFCRGSLVLAAAGVLSGRTMTGHPDYRNDYLAAGARYVDYADRRGKSDAPPPVVDGFLVTSLRSKYYRSATCEAARIAADNARRARADRAGRSSDGSPDGSPDGVPALPLVASAPARSALFAFMLTPDAAREAALLVGSLREWGGAMRDSPVICMAPGGPEAVPAGNRAGLEALGCEIVGFEPDPRIDSFPLAAKAGAAAAAERLASGKADVVVWMDPDTVFVREPSELLLPAGAVVAAKPVHHRLIGRPWGAGSDDFWRAVYAACGAEPSRDFPVTTIIDREPIGAYFNAGLLAVRPGAGVLAAWRDGLASACADPAVLAALTAPARRLFLHQAALAAAVVSVAGPGGFYELSFGYNYPAHMHASCPADLAPKKLDDLYTVRYDRWPAAPGSAGDAIAVPGRMREALTSLLARIPALGSA